MNERVKPAGSGPIRLLLVDDHASFRDPLAFVLDREPDFLVVAQSGSLGEARQILDRDAPSVDIAVVDLDLPDGSGTELIEHLSRVSPSTVVLLLSAFTERERLAGAIEAGASGIMHKSAGISEIADAIHRLRDGRSLLSQQEVIEAMRLLEQQRSRDHKAKAMISRLTPRELEVLEALAEGWSDKEISERLYMGLGTVRTHITSILRKLEARSRLQALLFAVRNGLARVD